MRRSGSPPEAAVARPPKDPRVTDLARYRRARERARKAPPPEPPRPPGQRLLGSRPRGGLILLAVIVVLALLSLAPTFM